MLHSEHRNADMGVRELRELRLKAIHLVAKQETDRKARPPIEEIDRMQARLDRGNLIVPRPQRFGGAHRFGGMLPGDRGLLRARSSQLNCEEDVR